MSSPKRQKIVAYTEEQLQQALSEVKKNMSIRHAARKFHIPYSTLLTKVKKLSSPRIHKRGHVRILSQEHEEQLVQGILHRRINGFPITKRQIYDSITALFKALKIITCFPDNGPGATWYKSFRKRHKLTETTLQNVDTCRKAGTEESLKNWFTNVKNFLGCRGLLDIDASRVFNCDEAGFILTPRLKKGLVRRKEKTDYSFIPGDENECVAAMICGNAEGQLAPPLVMLSCARMSHTLTESVPELWAIGKSGNGWVNSDSFFTWLTAYFHPWLKNNNIKFPIVLYLDGYRPYVTLEVTNFCEANSIILVNLHRNTAHLIQPFDDGIFRPMRLAWNDAVCHWKMENNGERLTFENFAPVLQRAIDYLDLQQLLPSAFRTTGLCPFSPEAVDYQKFFKNLAVSAPVDAGGYQSTPPFPEYVTIFDENLEWIL